ncbi:phosphoribosylanthranilate isomerase [Tumidithrix helvetica PCC 7403]|uniref:phosphoribosylanthranilate isomerase n=1 Tax=Tumidithrix helvetica TaxID=3457545 RepID=UPI003C81C361
MYVKICGITQLEQGLAIAKMGASCLGFICVPSSPRYIDSKQIRLITDKLPFSVDRVGVFMGVSVDTSVDEICQVVRQSGLSGIQLHGNESPEFCREIKTKLPDRQLIKALNIRSPQELTRVDAYSNYVDAILLDAYDPKLAGGTGKTLDWQMLASFRPPCPWWLAGGLSPENIMNALSQVSPDGVDVSSGVERSPGDKDLERVKNFIEAVKKSND